MKKFYLIIGILATLSLFTSCKDEDPAPLSSTLTNIEAVPGYGEVAFSWIDPDDPNFYYVDVTYTDSEGNHCSRKVTRFEEDSIETPQTPLRLVDSIVIAGFTDTKEYTFQFTCYSKDGGASAPVTKTVAPLQPPFEAVLPTVGMVPDFGGAVATWQNPTGKKISIRIRYQKNDKSYDVIETTSAKATGSLSISGLNTNERTFTVTVLDAKRNTSEKKDFVLVPYAESKFANNSWVITGFSTQEPAESPNGFASAAIDGNLSTFWHTQWSGGSPGYPHWFSFDMGKEQTISRFVVYRRQGDGRGQTKHYFSTSLDGVNWTDSEVFNMDATKNDGQSYRIASNPKARYVKYVATAGSNFFAFLSEIEVYGDPGE